VKQTLYQLKSRITICELVLLICIFALVVQNPFPPYKNYTSPKYSIASDGFGYYAYLPAVFIYHDLSFSFFDAAYKKNYHEDAPPWVRSFMIKTEAGTIDKYWIGESLLLLPFFLIAHWLSALLGLDADGYSSLYQYAVFFAAIFYLYFGCRFIYKYLLQKGFGKIIAAVSILIIVFGTNLFYYAIYEPSMSHVYSFFCVSAFCYFGSNYFNTPSFRLLLLTCLFALLIILVRPVNIIAISFLPFLAGNKISFINGFKKLKEFGYRLFFPLLIFSVLFLQAYIWHKQCGSWFVWSYPGERFFFSEPHFFDILFSYHKGLFLYMPACFLSLFGLINIYRNNRFLFYSIILSLLFIIYILSSWYAWSYSACLGNRAFVDFYFIFGVLIAFSFQLFKKMATLISLSIIYLLFIFFNHIQIYQYRHMIYDSQKMDKADYWKVFLQTDKNYEGLLVDWSDNDGERSLANWNKKLFFSSSYGFDTPDSLWSDLNIQKQDLCLSKPNVLAVNEGLVTGEFFHITEKQLPIKNRLIMEITLHVYLYNDFSGGYLYNCLKNNGQVFFFKQNKIWFKNAKIKDWTELKFYTELPTLNKGDELMIYLNNAGHGSLYLDNCKVNFYYH
jgi:hypothetical protein